MDIPNLIQGNTVLSINIIKNRQQLYCQIFKFIHKCLQKILKIALTFVIFNTSSYLLRRISPILTPSKHIWQAIVESYWNCESIFDIYCYQTIIFNLIRHRNDHHLPKHWFLSCLFLSSSVSNWFTTINRNLWRKHAPVKLRFELDCLHSSKVKFR